GSTYYAMLNRFISSKKVTMRSSIFALLLCAQLALPHLAAASDVATTPVPYYLPLSRVRVTATINTRLDLTKDPAEDVSEVAIISALVTDADQTNQLLTNVSGGFASDTSIDLSLASSGILTSTNDTAQGKLGGVVKDLVGLIANVASLSGAV